MRIGAAISGDLEKHMADEIDAATRGIQIGVKATTQTLKMKLRSQTTRALGPNVGRAWRGNFYRNQGMNAAGLVYSNAAEIIEAHSKGGVLRAKTGRFMAIPTEHVPRGRRGRRIIPSNWPDAKYGPLRYVPRPRGGGLLVADQQRKNKKGKFVRSNSKAAQAGKNVSTVVMYFLVPQVRLRKRLNLSQPRRRAEADLQKNIIRNYK